MPPAFLLAVSELQCGSVCILILVAAAGSQAGGIYRGISNSLMAPSDGQTFDRIIDLCGNENSSNVIDTANEVDLMELEGESWSCVRCTFLNHPALSVCECCSFERALESSKYLLVM